MPRSTVLVILAILLMMVGFWSFYSDTGPKHKPQVAADIVEPTPRLQVFTTPTPPSAEEIEAREQRQRQIANLQQQVTAEKARLDSQTQTLQTLKQRQENLGPDQSHVYTSQINQRDNEIQNLLDSMSNYRDAEDQINREASEAMSNQDSAARLAREQIDTNIRLAEQQLKNLESELNYVQNFPGQDYTQQQAKITQLRDEIAAQNNQLTLLRNQRVDISASVFGNSTQIKSLADKARQELRDSVEQTQDRIFTLRSEIDRLQGAQLQSQQNAENLQTQISRAEKAVQDQTLKVQTLEQDLQRLQSETAQE